MAMTVDRLLRPDSRASSCSGEDPTILESALRVFSYPPYQELPPSFYRDYHWVALDWLSSLLSPTSILQRIRYSYSAIPQAPCAVGHGVLGSAPEFLQIRDPLEFLVRYFHRYQENGICRLRLGRRSVILVGNGEAARFLLNPQNAAHFPRGESLTPWRVFSEGGLAEGRKTTEDRARVKDLLAHSRMVGYLPKMLGTTHEWVRFLREKSQHGSLNLGECCYRFTLAGLGRELFSSSVWDLTDEKEENCLQIIHSLHEIFQTLISQLIGLEDSLVSGRRLVESRERLVEALRPSIIQIFEVAHHFEELRTHIQSLTGREHDFSHPLDEGQIRMYAEEFMGFLQAAFETTGTALTWTLYELARNPSIQAQLILDLQGKEIHSVEDLKDIPLLRQVLEESLRLHPPIPFTLRDNTLPQAFPFCQTYLGETFVISPLLIHQLSWDNPEEFDPQRFKVNGEDGDMTSEEWQQKSQRYLPFISGMHQCPGRYFAKQKLQVAVAEVLRQFVLTVDDSKTETPVRSVLEVTLKPSNPIFVAFNAD